MTRSRSVIKFVACLSACLSMVACEKKFNPADGAPQSSKPKEVGDMSLVTVDKPHQFPLVPAEGIEAPAELKVTGTVDPDISRECGQFTPPLGITRSSTANRPWPRRHDYKFAGQD